MPHVSGLATICRERGVYIKEESMASKKPTPTVRELIGDVAPTLAELTEDVLFGNIWERPGLSKRDRSLITVATLVALNRTEQLPFHLRRALEHGISKDEIIELITHLAFYSGWPTAMSAVLLAKDVFRQDE
jgi:4-carboxymuconolactone decarboxylase